jgi:hypothetical protein
MLPFGNAVNLGLEPREEIFGRYYLRVAFSQTARQGMEVPKLDRADGLPELPRPWSDCLLERPLQGRVIEVLKELGRGQRPGLEEHRVADADLADIMQGSCAASPRVNSSHQCGDRATSPAISDSRPEPSM